MKRNFRKLLSVALAMIMLLSSGSILAFAADGERVTRTETLDLRKPEFLADCANEAEGWSWDAETQTLTLENANFSTENEPCIKADKINLVLVGDNVLTALYGDLTNAVIETGGITISGDNLTVNTDDGCAITGGVRIDSGNIVCNNGDITAPTFTMNGGNLTVGNTNARVGYGIYTLEKIEINGGNLVLKPGGMAGLFVQGDSSNSNCGLYIGGDSNITVYGGLCAAYVGLAAPAKTVIDTTGTITLVDESTGFYQYQGELEIKSGSFATELERDALIKTNASYDVIVEIGLANYSAVDAAIAKIPADLTPYTEESVAAVNAAVNAVDKELDVLDQSKVNEYADTIEAAVEGLEEMTFWQKVELFFANLFGGDGESDGECWLVKIFKAIINFFVKIFNTVVGIFR